MASPSKRVLVTILEQGWINPGLAILAAKMKDDARYDVQVEAVRKQPSETARNLSVKMALVNGFDYLLTIDHDVLPLKNPLDMIELGLDVVGCAVPQWDMTYPAFPIYFVGMDRAKNGYTEHKDRAGLQEVDAVGSGCLLLSRKVMEAIKSPFVRRFDEDGIAITGLDFLFCEKAKAAGFKVYCNYDYTADHFKEVSLLNVLNFKLS